MKTRASAHRHLGYAAFAVLIPFAQPAAAQDSVAPLSQDLLENRAARTFSTSPSQDRVVNRLNKSSWTAPEDVTVPFNINEGTNPNLRTSLTDWRTALSAAERKKLEAAKAAGDDLKMPAPIRHRPAPIDVWVDTRSQSIDNSTTQGADTTTYAGADYRVNSDVLVGGMMQMDESDRTAVGSPENVSGKGFMAGPYAAYRVTSNVFVDAKAAWGQSQDAARLGGDSANFKTDRSLSQARISGKWNYDDWQITPSGAVTHVTEAADGLAAAPTGVDETRISIRPELRRPIETRSGEKIEPFAYFQSSVNIDESDFADASPQNTVGGGLAITKTDAYNISATADYTETLNADVDQAVTGRFQVNVPLGRRP